MASVSITAAGQWWSTTHGWFVPSMEAWPNIRTAQISVSVLGTLSAGTVILLRRRLRAEYNEGVPGSAYPVKVINSTVISENGVTGYTDDFGGINSQYEYDIGCPTTFGGGDTVSVELS